MLKTFVQNINFMVVIQMVMAAIAVYIFQTFKISFNVHVSLFVSPIVFPLAFSINTDFQRREKVLENLAVFKSSGMIWYFCMREWRQPAGLNPAWITAIHGKLKSLLFHLREYLLTSKVERRNVILRAMYEDFSDANQLIEHLRASKLPSNSAIVSRAVHLLNMMCLSFERLRVIREYRSPRSIRSFNKVFIMFLPIILAPYFVYLNIENNNKWEPYFIAVLVAFVFSTLQGVQDKLDDPFDGMSEDDINLDTIDEWTSGSLEHAVKRSFDVGRSKVTFDPHSSPFEVRTNEFKRKADIDNDTPNPNRSNTPTIPVMKENVKCSKSLNEFCCQKYSGMLEGMTGSTGINRHSVSRTYSRVREDDYLKVNNNPCRGCFETFTTTTNVHDIPEQPPATGKVKSVDKQKDISIDIDSYIAYSCDEANHSKAALTLKQFLQCPTICWHFRPRISIRFTYH